MVYKTLQREINNPFAVWDLDKCILNMIVVNSDKQSIETFADSDDRKVSSLLRWIITTIRFLYYFASLEYYYTVIIHIFLIFEILVRKRWGTISNNNIYAFFSCGSSIRDYT